MAFEPGRVLLCGHGGVIAEAVAIELARSGAHVCVHDPGPSDPKATVTLERPGRTTISTVIGETRSVTESERFLARTWQERGPFNGMVVIVKSPIAAPPEQSSGSDWDDVMRDVLKIPFFLAKHFASRAADAHGGAIVFVLRSDDAEDAKRSLPRSVAASGMATMANVLAKALAPKVAVHAVLSGFASAPSMKENGSSWPLSAQLGQGSEDGKGRDDQAREIANVVRFVLLELRGQSGVVFHLG